MNRTCDSCGRNKPVSGGKTCERLKRRRVLGRPRTECPLCLEKLR